MPWDRNSLRVIFNTKCSMPGRNSSPAATATAPLIGIARPRWQRACLTVTLWRIPGSAQVRQPDAGSRWYLPDDTRPSMKLDIRRLLSFCDHREVEAGHRHTTPLRRAAAIAIVGNPYAGKY